MGKRSVQLGRLPLAATIQRRQARKEVSPARKGWEAVNRRCGSAIGAAHLARDFCKEEGMHRCLQQPD